LLVQAHGESILGNPLPFYDGRKSLFTIGPLPYEDKEFKVKLEDDDEPESSVSRTPAGCVFYIKFIFVSDHMYLNVNIFSRFH